MLILHFHGHSMAARLLALAATLLSVSSQLQPVTHTADCNNASQFPPLWRSVGYTPAELALQFDEAENMAVIGATPLRGVEQIRVHYLLDLLVTTSWNVDPSSPSGWRIGYVWDLLDTALDWLVANDLTPGFELMGSPVGFPQLPVSFWEVSSGNGKFLPNETATLWRQVVADTIIHYVGRYGSAEAQAVRWETWCARWWQAHLSLIGVQYCVPPPHAL